VPNQPSAAAQGLFGSDLQADALRQLIHELRTPLNAIVGFAEMIDGQFLGPAGRPLSITRG
jgi:signal transduction histidine kinase